MQKCRIVLLMRPESLCLPDCTRSKVSPDRSPVQFVQGLRLADVWHPLHGACLGLPLGPVSLPAASDCVCCCIRTLTCCALART